jgi:CRISPR-associated endonuclease/helicase Cas3
VLLAKPSKGDRPGRTIAEHTLDVVEAFRALFGSPGEPSDLAACWARFFRIEEPELFVASGLLAVACHDWGKANGDFQDMLQGNRSQLLRHEVISALIMEHPGVREVLEQAPGVDLPVVLAAVVGHHLKFRDEAIRPRDAFDHVLHLNWEGLLRQFEAAPEALPLPVGLSGRLPTLWSFTPRPGVADLYEATDRLRERLEEIDDELQDDPARRRLLWAVRSALIAADSAGSGLFREGKPVGSWIAAAFDPSGRLDDGAVHRKVIGPRVDRIGGRWSGWNPFQEACGDPANVPARALLLAPCGSGKTLAAWRWIAARCAERPIGRAIFLYPTRGTATEGYRDYAALAGPEEAALVHGTAELDVDDIHPDLPEEDRIRLARLFSLQQWPRRIFSATVDQFLGFLQHGYGPTCLLPLLADSAVVIDEVHSFDRGMFSALLQFLEHFDVPVLCMTATLLPRRRDQLALGGRALGDRGLAIVDGLGFAGEGDTLREIADYGRYRVAALPDAVAADALVREALDDGRRVLWVVNTVDRAQSIARRFAADPATPELATAEGAPVFCYHCRFRLGDRKTQHARVVGAFGPGRYDGRGVLAATTQVCEMSLDLDADLLVTEHAPATALVQRLGRCCRDLEAHRAGRVGEVVLYPPESPAPYSADDLRGVDTFIAALASAGVVSQSALEDLLESVPHAADLPRECRFIEGGPWAASGEENFRDIEDRTRQMLLPGDVEEYLGLRRERASWRAQELILTAPKSMEDPVLNKELPAWLILADTRRLRYRPALGLCEERPDSFAIA